MPLVQEPVSFSERLKLARQCTTAMKIKELPTLVDEINDGVGAAYSGWPDRLFLVGTDGRMAFSGGRGPFGFKPELLAAAIEKELKAGGTE